MRLGQLARKLALRPGEIIEFLTAQSIPNDGSNTRLEDEQVALVLRRFAPSVTLESILQADSGTEPDPRTISPVEDINIKTEAEIPSSEKEPEPPSAPVYESNSVETISEIPVATSEISEEKTDVIKAPKMELPGLKVVGKIELPETKKKEEKPESAEPEAETTIPREEKEKNRPKQERGRDAYSKNRFERPGKNPLALKREREAREAEKRREAEAKKDKERRTKNYLKKVKPAVPTKRVRMVEEDVIEMPHESGPAPKTWIGKFWRWFWRE